MKPLKIMESHLEQHFDNLAKKVVKSSELEKPSLDFTANVMAKIEVQQEISSITVYKPLISKKAWFIIVAVVIASLTYAIFGVGVDGLSWGKEMDLSFISDNKFTKALGSITFSKTLMYAIAFFGAAWFIQITMTKHYLDKRLEF